MAARFTGIGLYVFAGCFPQLPQRRRAPCGGLTRRNPRRGFMSQPLTGGRQESTLESLG